MVEYYEKDGSENKNFQKKAAFNMAVNTLERLGNLLSQINEISSDFTILKELRQQRKLNLIKQFYVQSSPLLEKDSEKFKDLLEWNLVKAKKFEKRVGNTPRFIGIVSLYSRDLDRKLNNILIEIQQTLQEKGYFMPPSRRGSLF